MVALYLHQRSLDRNGGPRGYTRGSSTEAIDEGQADSRRHLDLPLLQVMLGRNRGGCCTEINQTKQALK